MQSYASAEFATTLCSSSGRLGLGARASRALTEADQLHQCHHANVGACWVLSAFLDCLGLAGSVALMEPVNFEPSLGLAQAWSVQRCCSGFIGR